ncbi:MAG TPA: protease complex subunit PrcB family protein [Clostridiales bacterium]|nr:protease complex subunit PrcB family protein [Clostridiales bacterium]
MKVKKGIIVLMIGLILLLVSCDSSKSKPDKLKGLEFTVVEDADVPEKLMEAINDKKSQPFKTTYSDEEYLYIAVGYGEKPTGGYSISVDEFYLTDNAIYLDTNLIGPSQEEFVSNAVTYPYVVLKTEFTDKRVLFD